MCAFIQQIFADHYMWARSCHGHQGRRASRNSEWGNKLSALPPCPRAVTAGSSSHEWEWGGVYLGSQEAMAPLRQFQGRRGRGEKDPGRWLPLCVQVCPLGLW